MWLKAVYAVCIFLITVPIYGCSSGNELMMFSRWWDYNENSQIETDELMLINWGVYKQNTIWALITVEDTCYIIYEVGEYADKLLVGKHLVLNMCGKLEPRWKAYTLKVWYPEEYREMDFWVAK